MVRRASRELVTGALRLAGRVSYELRLRELEPGESLDFDGYTIAAVPVRHRTTAFGYVLYEPARPGAFDPARAQALGVRPGPDFGRLQRGEPVDGVQPEQVMGPSRPGRKLVLSGDTVPCESLRVAAHGADLLVHEATFADEEAERAEETHHSTAAGAARLAREAQVRLLALTHLSTRHPVRQLRDEARSVFEETVVPRDFDEIEIPFAERGDPVLTRWEERIADPA